MSRKNSGPASDSTWTMLSSTGTNQRAPTFYVLCIISSHICARFSFDLWEEVSGSSFWTTSVQHRALRQGATLANAIGEIASANIYATQADNLLCFMQVSMVNHPGRNLIPYLPQIQSYWDPSGLHMTANTAGGRSGVDANTVLASIYSFDPAAGCDAATFQPCSDKALASLKVYVDSFRSIYSINKGISSKQPVATGRYAEDVYMGGNVSPSSPVFDAPRSHRLAALVPLHYRRVRAALRCPDSMGKPRLHNRHRHLAHVLPTIPRICSTWHLRFLDPNILDSNLADQIIRGRIPVCRGQVHPEGW